MRLASKVLLLVLAIGSSVNAQACQFLNWEPKVLKKVWVNDGLGITLTPVSGSWGSGPCPSVSVAVIHKDHTRFKEMYALAMTALASGRPVQGWYCGCVSAFGSSVPNIIDLGVEE